MLQVKNKLHITIEPKIKTVFLSEEQNGKLDQISVISDLPRMLLKTHLLGVGGGGISIECSRHRTEILGILLIFSSRLRWV